MGEIGRATLVAIETRDAPALERAIAAERPTAEELAVILARAAATGYREGVSVLVRAGADPKRRLANGWSPLLVAIQNGNGDVARDLLEAGADAGARTPDGVTALDLADALGDEALVARLRPRPSPQARLASAAAAGDVAAMLAAITDGAAVDARDARGWTPLMHAALHGREGGVGTLVNRRASVTAAAPDGTTPLAAAVLGGNGAVVSRLIEAGAPVDAAPEGGWRPLVLAISLRNEAVARVLLDAGASPAPVGREQAAPTHLAAAAGLGALADRLAPAARRQPPAAALAEAIASGDARLTADFLRRGLDVNAPLKDGVTPLHFALAARQFPVAEMLAREFSPRMRDRNALPGGDGGNVFHTAARVGAPETTLAALRALANNEPGGFGGYMNELDDRGRTPLLVSLMANSPASRWMSNAGISDHILRLGDREGVTPILAATLQGNAAAVRGLVATGVPLDTGRGRPSLQDIARARQDWLVLAALPDDRRPPVGLVRGASREVRREFQRLLAAWGYYRGPLDGSFGTTTVAAAKAFLLDRRREIVAMAGVDGSLEGWSAQGHGNGRSYRGPKVSWGQVSASWIHYEWTDGVEFTGFNEAGGGKPMRNGFGYVRKRDGSEYIVLMGETGEGRDNEILR